MTTIAVLHDLIASIPLDLPDPEPVAPPGAETPVARVLGIAKWVGLVLAVLGVIVVAIRLTINSRRGEAAMELGQLGFIAIAVFLVGGAVSLIGFISGS